MSEAILVFKETVKGEVVMEPLARRKCDGQKIGHTRTFLDVFRGLTQRNRIRQERRE